MGALRSGLVFGTILALAVATGCSKRSSRSGNSPAVIGAPSGPGTVNGADPAFSSMVNVGDSLDLTITATDPNPTDTVSITARVTGGSLTPALAGFLNPFPDTVSGSSPQTLALTGTAAAAGDIVLTFEADDGSSRIDSVTLTITMNGAPQIAAPAGPGTVTGADPAFSSVVAVGDPLDFQVTATDGDVANNLTFVGTEIGGSLSALAAGFVQTFPITATGLSPQMLDGTGIAASVGDITLGFDVDDGLGGTDSITLSVNILPRAPRVMGFARYTDENRNGVPDAGDLIVVPFSEDVTVNAPSPTDLVLPVAGDSLGVGANLTAGPGTNEVTITLGSAPGLKTRQTFSIAALLTNDPSGIDVSATIAVDAIESTATGDDAINSLPIDIIPAFVDSGQSLGSSYTSSIAVADLDADGDLDFAESDVLGGGTLIWLNGGTGTFTNSGQSLGATSTDSLAVGDVDSDGDLDLLSASGAAGKVWLNDGSAIFTDSGQTLTNGDPHTFRLGDLDADGDLDLVVANASGLGNEVWTNDGAGNFTDSGQSLGTGETWSAALGDVDGDGDLDFLAGNDNGEANRVWLNDGAGNFSDSGQTLGSGATRAIGLGDMDSDGDLDIVAGNVNGPDRVWLNDGNGTFTDSGQTIGTTSTVSMALDDFDSDGDLDLFAGKGFGQTSPVWINDGTGLLTDSGMTFGPYTTFSLALADLDGDGDLDLIEGIDGGNLVWMNSLSGTWGAVSMADSGQRLGLDSTFSIAVGDVDRDGDVDIVSGNTGAAANRVWLNDGDGAFADSGQSLGSSSTYGIALGDVDSDGDLDIVSGNSNQGNRVWRNDGAGSFTDSGQSLGNNDTWHVTLADVDRDGDLDIVAANRGGDANKVWWNDGSGTFTDSGQNLGASDSPFAGLGDVDGDGDLDLVVGVSVLQPDEVWLNDGSGIYTSTAQALGTDSTSSMALADVDRDGVLEMITGYTGGGTLAVWENDGLGSFTDSGQTFGGGTIYSVHCRDVDGDGDLDILAGGGASNKIWLNDGTGTFSDSGLAMSNNRTLSAAVSDVDGDGDLDLISGNTPAGPDPSNRVWLNE